MTASLTVNSDIYHDAYPNPCHRWPRLNWFGLIMQTLPPESCNTNSGHGTS